MFDKTAFGPIVLVVVVAVGWIVPATVIVRRQRRGVEMSAWLVGGATSGLFGVVLLLHLVDAPVLAQPGLLELRV